MPNGLAWMVTLGWVMLGGAIGAGARFGAGVAAEKLAGRGAVVWATLAVNVAGCLLIGFLAAHFLSTRRSDWALLMNRPLMVTGFCGALTTFSTFGFEVLDLWQRRGFAAALGLVVLHLTLGLGAVALGQRLGA